MTVYQRGKKKGFQLALQEPFQPNATALGQWHPWGVGVMPPRDTYSKLWIFKLLFRVRKKGRLSLRPNFSGVWRKLQARARETPISLQCSLAGSWVLPPIAAAKNCSSSASNELLKILVRQLGRLGRPCPGGRYSPTSLEALSATAFNSGPVQARTVVT